MAYTRRRFEGKRAIIYSRVSSRKQAELGNSLPAQKNKLERFCREEGIHILKHFVEEGISASTFEKRLQFQEALKLVRLNKKQKVVDLFLVVTWDRFSRDMKQAIKMIEEIEEHGDANTHIEHLQRIIDLRKTISVTL